MQIDKRLKDALDQTGLPWAIERGGRHYKVKIAGKLAAIFPLGTANERERRSLLNTISQVRRAANCIKLEMVNDI
jgi:hypothetical protein